MAESIDKQRQRLNKMQLKAAELEKSIKSRERRLENRKLIILGRFLLKLMERGIISEQTFTTNFDQFLTRNVDRELFEYSPLPEETKGNKKRDTSAHSPVNIPKPKTTESTPPPAPAEPPTTKVEKSPLLASPPVEDEPPSPPASKLKESPVLTDDFIF